MLVQPPSPRTLPVAGRAAVSARQRRGFERRVVEDPLGDVEAPAAGHLPLELVLLLRGALRALDGGGEPLLSGRSAAGPLRTRMNNIE